MQNNAFQMSRGYAPWDGFWFRIASAFRYNILFIFSLIWFGLSGIPIYLKFLFIVIGFCLDRLATLKALDTNIHTFNDFDAYIQSREKLDKIRFSKSLNYLKMLGLIVLFILLVEILVCLTAEWQPATKSKVFTLAYGVPGIVILFMFSRDFIYELNVSDIHQPAAWNTITYLEKLGVLHYRWIGTLLFVPVLFASIAFIFLINTIPASSRASLSVFCIAPVSSSLRLPLVLMGACR